MILVVEPEDNGPEFFLFDPNGNELPQIVDSQDKVE